ncbi:plastid developmental protein DAG [Thalictrum thalictroides]|uniref:Plastid developmental protein DAG n=1 Tax=Thalictrum thalictroides TaxID=46969 RepID=A0A7J6WPZ2_THATH|nr:plastid developmental protein DAG [Thalictrum thalictroides]
MYLVSCGICFGFGIELDKSDMLKLRSSPGIGCVWKDYRYYERKEDPNFKSASRFNPMNRNHRLENIFSYHYLSEPNENWKGDQWLVIVKQPDVGFCSEDQILKFIVQILMKVLGSEEEVRKRIYVIWYKLPFGFGAEIDKDASDKLREMPDVLSVLPDYAFDVKDRARTFHEGKLFNRIVLFFYYE